MKTTLTSLLSILLFQLTAQVKLPKYISDGVIFQRNEKVKIWGYASPTEKVELHFKNKKYTATTNADSIWQIILPKQKAGGPYVINIHASNHVKISNILFGDVWICSGQSNMETNFERLKDKYPDIVKSAFNSNIRQFYVPRTYNFNKTQDDFIYGEWKEVNPDNIKQFSGVAYFFATSIYEKEKVPIGLINNAIGGAPVQSWLNEESLKMFPEYLSEALKFKNQNYIDSINSYNEKNNSDWFQNLNNTDEGLKHQWHKTNLNRSDWKSAVMPALWSTFDTTIKSGSIWLHKTFTVDKNYLNQKSRLFLGCIVDADSVYVNGVFVGSTSYQYPPRKYDIPTHLLKEGKNEITIRVIDQNGIGGFVEDKPYHFLFSNNEMINLKGAWQYKIGTQLPKIGEHVFIQWKPLGLYNTMLFPLFHYPVKGILWYQGEAHVNKPQEYFSLMNELISIWRKGWNKPKLPVYYVQLPNFGKSKSEPTESNLAELRQQQLNLLKIKNTAMAVTIDIGEWNDLHPHNKKDVGYRLALHALKNSYHHKNIFSSGPLLKTHKIQDEKVILNFSHVENGIKNVNSLNNFELAGEDKKYVKAIAIINQKAVKVFSEKIQHPKYLRYAWADNPLEINFYNVEGLPASPFEIKL